MRRWWTIGGTTEVMALVWVLTAAPVFAGQAITVGARPAPGGQAAGWVRGEATSSISGFFQEVTAAFTATPTTGSLGDALEASRSTFSTAEAIEFNAVLFETGLAGTTANLQLYLLNQDGRLVTPTFFQDGVLAPADRTGFFMQLSPGTVPGGRLKWAMVIVDGFGNLFVTPFQALDVQ